MTDKSHDITQKYLMWDYGKTKTKQKNYNKKENEKKNGKIQLNVNV